MRRRGAGVLILMFLIAPLMAAESEDEIRQNYDYLTDGQQLPYHNFCLQRLLKERNDRLICNWARSFGHACGIRSQRDYFIEEGSVISGPKVVGRCRDGRKVVRVEHY